jgi:5'(3')-deoxyribonucleotidase
MDEVITDALSALLRAYNAEFGAALTPHDFPGREFWEAVPDERRDRIHAYHLADGFFRRLDVMPGSQEVIARLHERHEVFITTAAMEFPISFTPKYEWLREHFPFIPDNRIVFCGDKSIIQADYLIDDRPRHFEHFVGQGILFTAPHNLAETRYPRVNTWQDVAAMFL